MNLPGRMREEGDDPVLVPVLLLFAFSLPITISASEAFAILLIPLWLWRRRIGALPAFGWGAFGFFAALFIAVATLSSLMGTRPAHSLEKMTRFALLLPAFLMPLLEAVSRRSLVRRMAGALVVGTTLKAAYDVVRIPVAAWLASQGGPTAGAGTGNIEHRVTWENLALFNQGNMRDPQFYLVAVLLLVALVAVGRPRLDGRLFWPSLLLNGLALLLHFKRGALAATVLGVVLIALLARRPRLLLALLGVGILLCALPQFRERIAMTRNEFSVSLQGRYPLWTEAAPRLLNAHSFGIGWKALSHNDIRSVTPHVQRKLNHLHNNVLQIAVETGWLGAGVWVAWMLAALTRHAAAWRLHQASAGPSAGLALGLLAGFVGLMSNGLVEYNFGDSEIFMLLGLIWGGGIALARTGSASPE